MSVELFDITEVARIINAAINAAKKPLDARIEELWKERCELQHENTRLATSLEECQKLASYEAAVAWKDKFYTLAREDERLRDACCKADNRANRLQQEKYDDAKEIDRLRGELAKAASDREMAKAMRILGERKWDLVWLCDECYVADQQGSEIGFISSRSHIRQATSTAAILAADAYVREQEQAKTPVVTDEEFRWAVQYLTNDSWSATQREKAKIICRKWASEPENK